jgi:MoxR-like ATPase
MEDGGRLWPYAGTGSTISERNRDLEREGSAKRIELPAYVPPSFDDPAGYVARPGLRAAVNVALTLGQPLLVTGEPGSGKTQLAWSIAYELELPEKEERSGEGRRPPLDQRRAVPIVFHTKTTSAAADLFYRYDGLRHFQDVQLVREKPVLEYITFEALGKAIILTMPPDEARFYLPKERKRERPVRSVVLIDEIDKAPRDLPNDVLNEIEVLSFEVKELGQTFKVEDERLRPIIVLTSNSEKDLPDAFLRRCVFYHIPFPKDFEDLKEIVDRRLKKPETLPESIRVNALNHFLKIRDLKLEKKPATAELLAWVRILEQSQIDVNDKKNKDKVMRTYTVLAKKDEDFETIAKKMWGTTP